MQMRFDNIKKGMLLASKSSRGMWYFYILRKYSEKLDYIVLSLLPDTKEAFVSLQLEKTNEDWDSSNFIGNESLEISKDDLFNNIFRMKYKLKRNK